MLTFLQICLIFALFEIISAQQKYCDYADRYPPRTDFVAFPALACSDTTVVHLPSPGHRGEFLADATQVHCTKARDVRDQIVLVPAFRRLVNLLIQDYCRFAGTDTLMEIVRK